MLSQQKNRQSLLSRLSNPKYIMVYSTIGVFLIIYLVGAILFGDKGFTTLRTFMNMFIDNAYIGISAVGMTMVLITRRHRPVGGRSGLPDGHDHRLWQLGAGGGPPSCASWWPW